MSPRPRSARWLARRFEVSARTIERDLDALRQSGVPRAPDRDRDAMRRELDRFDARLLLRM